MADYHSLDDLDYSTAEPITDPRQADFSRPEEVEGEGFVSDFGNAFTASRELDSTLGAIQRIGAENEFPLDPSYNLDNLEELTKDVPVSQQAYLQEQLMDAKSEDHAQYIKDRFVTEMDASKRIDGFGMTGLAARLTANLFDEGAIALTLATGGGAALYKMSRLQRALRIAGLSAAENAALEATVVAGSQTRTPVDVIFAGLFGGVLGGALGSIGRSAPKAGSVAAKVHEDVPARAHTSIRDLEDAEVRDLTGADQPAPSATVTKFADDVEDSIVAETTHAVRRVTPEAPSPQRVADTARTAEIDARIAQLAAEDIPAPARPKVLDLTKTIDNTVSAMMDLRASTDLSPAARTRIEQEVGKAKREFLAAAKEADPDNFPLAGINPKFDDFTKVLPKLKKLIAKVEKSYAKDKAAFDKQLDAVDAELDALRVESEELAKRLEADDGLKSAGAAETGASARQLEHTDEDVLEEIHSVPETALKKFRFGTYAILAKSENAFVRWLGDILIDDAVGKVGHATNRKSAEAIGKRHLIRQEAKYSQERDAAFREWRIENDIRGVDYKFEDMLQFNREVADAIEFGSPSAALNRAAKAASTLFRETMEFAKKAGVKGFDMFEARDSYLPHIASADEFTKAAQRYEMVGSGTSGLQGPLEELMFKALQRANPGGDVDVLKKIAQGYVKNTRTRAAGVGGKYTDISRTVDPEYLWGVLHDMGLDDETLDYAVAMVKNTAKADNIGKTGRARHRTLLDMDTDIRVRDKETGDLVTLSMRDLYERDVDALTKSYARSIGGWAGIAERTKGTAIHITSEDEFNRVLQMAANMEADGISRDSSGRLAKMSARTGSTPLDAEIDIIDQAFNAIIGRPINDPHSLYTQARRKVNDWNFATSMGMVSFSQFAEFGPVTSQIGVRGMARLMPEMHKILDPTRDSQGLAKHPLVRVAEEWTGTGTEFLRAKTNHIWTSDPEAFGKGMSGYEAGMHRVKNAVSMPLRMMMTGQQRLLAVHMLQDFGDIAMGRVKMSKSKMNRLAAEGIDEPMLKRINEGYQKNASWKKDSPSKLVDPNFDKWDDLEARDVLLGAMFGMGRRAIQENDIGNINPWLSRNMGQTLMQFRTFVMGAWEKHLLHGVHMRDMEAFNGFALSMMFAGLAYAGQAHVRTIGMEERERAKYLKEKLTDENIAKAAFSRSTHASMVPSLWDTGKMMLGMEQDFSNTRASGYSQNLLTGNPTVALTQRAPAAVSGILSSLRPDREFSQKNLKDLQYSLPMANFLGIQQLWNLAGTQLPEQSE